MVSSKQLMALVMLEENQSEEERRQAEVDWEVQIVARIKLIDQIVTSILVAC